MAPGDARAHRLVGRGEHAGAARDGLGPADALEAAVLQDAQELGLEQGVEVADLVEEEGAALRELEAAGAARGGAR